MPARPEFELIPDQSHSVRYLSHGNDSPLIRWHFHREYELHLICKTEGKVFIGDYVGDYKPESIYLCGPNLPHNWVANAPAETGTRDKVITFTERFMTCLMEDMPEFQVLKPMLDDSRFGIEFTKSGSRPLMKLFDKIGESRGTTRLLAFLTLLDELAQSGEYRILSSRLYEEETDPDIDERINVVVEYLARNYHREISLEEVAHLLSLSPYYFSRYFKQATGRGFTDFLIRLRISKACERLEMTSDSITRICYEVGYSNIANFNRQFLKIKGMTPRQYRDSLTVRDAKQVTQSHLS